MDYHPTGLGSSPARLFGAGGPLRRRLHGFGGGSRRSGYCVPVYGFSSQIDMENGLGSPTGHGRKHGNDLSSAYGRFDLYFLHDTFGASRGFNWMDHIFGLAAPIRDLLSVVDVPGAWQRL